jgi:hypothetical protein
MTINRVNKRASEFGFNVVSLVTRHHCTADLIIYLLQHDTPLHWGGGLITC